MNSLFVFALTADVILTTAVLWQVKVVIRGAHERADRATAALLHVAGESRAAYTVHPAAAANGADPADGRSRKAQVGLSPR